MSVPVIRGLKEEGGGASSSKICIASLVFSCNNGSHYYGDCSVGSCLLPREVGWGTGGPCVEGRFIHVTRSEEVVRAPGPVLVPIPTPSSAGGVVVGRE